MGKARKKLFGGGGGGINSLLEKHLVPPIGLHVSNFVLIYSISSLILVSYLFF